MTYSEAEAKVDLAVGSTAVQTKRSDDGHVTCRQQVSNVVRHSSKNALPFQCVQHLQKQRNYLISNISLLAFNIVGECCKNSNIIEHQACCARFSHLECHVLELGVVDEELEVVFEGGVGCCWFRGSV